MIFTRLYKIRPISKLYGKQVTVPPHSSFSPGDKVAVLADDFMLVVPLNYEVDEGLLRKAVKIKP